MTALIYETDSDLLKIDSFQIHDDISNIGTISLITFFFRKSFFGYNVTKIQLLLIMVHLTILW
jgi:hypothetical protein